MNDLCCPITDAVHAQKLQGFRVEDELQETVGSSQHLTLREFLVVCDPHLTWQE